MADMFNKEELLKERKSVIDVFMEYRHFKLEESEINKLKEIEKIKNEELNNDDDEYLTINFEKSETLSNVEDELIDNDDSL